MADVLSPEIWKHQWEAFMSAPYIIFPLLILAAGAVWWLRGALVKEQIAVLKAENESQNTIFENRRQLAAEKVELANQAKAEVERQFNDLKASLVGNDALAARVARMESAIEKLSAANNAVRSAIGIASGASTATAISDSFLNTPLPLRTEADRGRTK
jgi:hypothetical protein